MAKDLNKKEIRDILVRKRVEEFLLIPVVFCALFVLPYMIYHQVSHGLKSTAWPKAPGRILSSEIEEIRYDDKKKGDRSPASEKSIETGKRKVKASYRPIVKYEYWIKGKKYGGTNLAYIHNGAGKDWAKTKVARYPSRKKVIISYDPLNPNISVLEAGAPGAGLKSTTIIFLTFELLLIFIAAVFLWDIYRLNFQLVRARILNPFRNRRK